MKKTRKLIPALAMLVMSAVLMSTASFAWFSMNTKVTATNMQIQATASKNLMISLAKESGYGSTVNMNTSLSNCAPVSTIGGDTANPSFFKILAVGNNMNQDNYAAGSDTTFTEASAGTDYAKKTVYVQVVGDTASNLKATINTTSGVSAALDPAIRVMLAVNDGTNTKTYIYLPIANAAYGTSNQAVSSIGTDNKAVLGEVKTSATSSTTLLSSLTADTAYQIDIYAWYEGEDTNCKATNTLDLAAYNFTVTLTVE